MPKAPEHFDAPGLIAAVQQQDIGLMVTTNNPSGFRRILYSNLRKLGIDTISIFANPRSKFSFYLVNKAALNDQP